MQCEKNSTRVPEREQAVPGAGYCALRAGQRCPLDSQKKTAPEVPFLRYVSPALIQLYHIITTVAVNQFDKRIDTRKHRLFIQREGDNIFT